MTEPKSKAKYAEPATQTDLEERLKKGNKSDRVLSTADVADKPEPEADAPGYVGVDPMYQNAANKTERPGASSKGVEAKVFASFTGEEQEDLSPDDDEDEDDDAISFVDRSGETRTTGGGSK